MWEENKHPRDENGQFTSKGNEGQGESNEKKSTNSNKNIPHKEELEKTVNTLLKEGKNKEQIKNYLKGFDTVTYTDEMDKYVDSLVGDSSFDVEIDEDFERSFGPAPDKEDDPEGYKKYMDSYNKWQNDNFDNDYESEFDEFDNEDDKPYDFDKWAKETNSDKTKHAGYIDVDSSYDAGAILSYINNDPDWSISSNGGDTYLLKHKSGPVYSYNKDTQQISLTTEKAEQEKGKQAHAKELTDYIKNQIKNGKTDPEQIYQDSPYSIHSHDEMINITNDLLNKDNKTEEIDYENVEYPKGTSKEYTMVANKRYQDALPVLEKAGIKLEDFGEGKETPQGGYEDNAEEIMDKYVFEPFRKKYPSGNNDAWEKEYQPLYDAIEAVGDKRYNDWWIKNKGKKNNTNNLPF